MKIKTISLTVAALAIAGLLLAQGVGARTLKFGWDPNTEPDLAGYTFYYGTVASGITNQALIATNTITLTGLANGNYWFAVTARTTNFAESGFSNILLVSVPRNPSNLKTLP